MIRIRLSRKLGEMRWTQAMLVRVTKIRSTTISEMYNEISERVSLDYLDRICKALECDLSDIIEYIPDKPETK